MADTRRGATFQRTADTDAMASYYGQGRRATAPPSVQAPAKKSGQADFFGPPVPRGRGGVAAEIGGDIAPGTRDAVGRIMLWRRAVHMPAGCLHRHGALGGALTTEWCTRWKACVAATSGTATHFWHAAPHHATPRAAPCIAAPRHEPQWRAAHSGAQLAMRRAQCATCAQPVSQGAHGRRCRNTSTSIHGPTH